MRLMIAYGLIAFAIGTGVSSLVGRWLDIPWLFGQFTADDPGMAMCTGFATVALGVGSFLLHSVWREGKTKRKNH